MLSIKKTRLMSLLILLIFVLNLGLIAMPEPAFAVVSPEKSEVIVLRGYNYKLNKVLTVYKGPGKEYGVVYRKDLKPSTRKHSVKKSKIAKLKKGTMVTCLQVKAGWMKIPSGWIKIGKNNVKAVKKPSRK